LIDRDVLYVFSVLLLMFLSFFFQAEDGIRDDLVTGVQTCALPILRRRASVLSPMARMAAAGGPMNSSDAAATASANGARSDRNPYPGCTAWHPELCAAATSFPMSR